MSKQMLELAEAEAYQPSKLLSLLDSNNGARAEWIRKHLDYPNKDWCLIWPFARSDTGYALFGSPPRKVSRLMCEHRHGPAPTPEHHAAHSCDRGHEACVNPWHLDWKTPTDNQLDRRRNGKTPPRKLTPEQAREIRDLKGLEHTKNTAARYGIRESNVRLIQSGKTWREEAKDRYFLSDEDVLRIRAAARDPGVVKALAAEYGVSTSTICRVRDRKSYQFVEDSEPTPLLPASPRSQAVSAPQPPAGYQKLPDGTRCRCPKMWQDGKGGHWCCLVSLSRPLLSPTDKANGGQS